MFRDYFELVKESYKAKRRANKLSPLLSQPTTAKLRQECMAVCQERFQKKDQNTLRVFFGPGEDQKAYLKLIENSALDSFKPLVNFLKEKTNTTEDKNIELLAWLIDFELRPFELSRNYGVDSFNAENSSLTQTTQKQTNSIDTKLVLTQQFESPMTGDKHVETSHKYQRRLVMILALAILIIGSLGLVVYLSVLKNNSPLGSSGSCMYWAGDHYEPVSCNKKMLDTLVVALDSARLIGFKRITKPDTITMYSLGKVWYIKREGKLEFYTMGGQHPVYVNQTLKPVTAYIINQYLVDKKD